MDETTRLWYLRPTTLYDKEKPFHIFEHLPSGYKAGNIEFELGPTQTIHDVRGHEAAYNLETHGFAFCTRALPEVDWDDEARINAKYLADIRDMLEELPGLPGEVEICEVFDWRRRKSGSKEVLQNPAGDRMVQISPAYVVHVDQSPAGVLDRVRRHFESNADELLRNHRVQVFNFWRPLVDVVEDIPLAVCDARTVRQDDLVECEFINSDYIRRSYMVKHSDEHRFHYLSRMTKNEMCIFKVFDSADVDGMCVPHAAFEHAKVPLGFTPRESIEVRLLVLSPLEEARLP